MFQGVSVRLIAQRVLPRDAMPCFVTGELAHQKLVMSRPREGRHHIYCSQNNAGALELLQEVQSDLQVDIVWTSNRSEMATCSCMLIYLNSLTWTSGKASEDFSDEVQEAMGAGIRLTLVHEMRGRHGVEFSTFFEHERGATPRSLIREGIYHQIALSLLDGPFRRTGLANVLLALGGAPRRISLQGGAMYAMHKAMRGFRWSWAKVQRRRALLGLSEVYTPPLALEGSSGETALCVCDTVKI